MTEIALVDCNNFFVSCEQLMNPDLLGKPVCVLSNNDGCIIARSNEAKKLGITMGMPLFMAKKQFRHTPVIYLSGRHHLYRDISKRIMKKLSSFTPSVEIYSIDEAFLDLSGLKKLYRMSYKEIILKIKNEIREEIGIPVSIGLAPTKTLAKLACEKAKKLPYTNGIYRIRFRNIEEEMQNTPIEEIWGVGKNTSALFHKYGIYKASEIVKQNDFWLDKIWGKRGIELKQELEGISVYPVIDKPALPKSIQRTSSFPQFSTDKNYIKAQLHIHLHDACRKICILASLAFGSHVYPDTVHTEGITGLTLQDVEYASNWGGVIKLIGRAKKQPDGKVIATVYPAFLAAHSQLAGIDDVFNGILIRGNATGDVVFYGRGAGKMPTASAVVADMIDISKANCTSKSLSWSDSDGHNVADYKTDPLQFYIRASLLDHAQTTVSDVMGGVTFLSRPEQPEDEIAFVTGQMTEKELESKLEVLGNLIKVQSMIRVLDY